MRAVLAKWQDAGYHFTLDWLLRNINAVATGRAPFNALDGVPSDAFQDAMTRAVNYVSRFLDVVAGRLGLDHDRVLMGRYAAPVVARYLHTHGGQFSDARERDRILYWYVNAALRGQFPASTETVLAQDFDTVAREGIKGLVETLARSRGGSLTVGADEFEGFGRGSRFYPLLYLLTRVGGARDLGSGLPLKAQLLGHLSALQVHHIFPRRCSTPPATAAARSTPLRTSASSPKTRTSSSGSGIPRSIWLKSRKSTLAHCSRSGYRQIRACGASIAMPTSWLPVATSWRRPRTASLTSCGRAPMPPRLRRCPRPSSVNKSPTTDRSP
jgi:hypothetical protein